jgi:hypothetical protein
MQRGAEPRSIEFVENDVHLTFGSRGFAPEVFAGPQIASRPSSRNLTVAPHESLIEVGFGCSQDACATGHCPDGIGMRAALSGDLAQRRLARHPRCCRCSRARFGKNVNRSNEGWESRGIVFVDLEIYLK